MPYMFSLSVEAQGKCGILVKSRFYDLFPVLLPQNLYTIGHPSTTFLFILSFLYLYLFFFFVEDTTARES